MAVSLKTMINAFDWNRLLRVIKYLSARSLLSPGGRNPPIATNTRTRGIFMQNDQGENLSRHIKGKPRASLFGAIVVQF